MSFFFRYAVSIRWEREQERLRQEMNSSTDPITNKHPCLSFTIEDFHKYFCCCARRVGSFFFLLERKDGSPIITAGPCWPFCSFVTVPLILILSTLVMVFIVFNQNSGMVSSEMLYIWIFLSICWHSNNVIHSYNTTIHTANIDNDTNSLGGLHWSTAQY